MGLDIAISIRLLPGDISTCRAGMAEDKYTVLNMARYIAERAVTSMTLPM